MQDIVFHKALIDSTSWKHYNYKRVQAALRSIARIKFLYFYATYINDLTIGKERGKKLLPKNEEI